jgi:hypothetical protein
MKTVWYYRNGRGHVIVAMSDCIRDTISRTQQQIERRIHENKPGPLISSASRDHAYRVWFQIYIPIEYRKQWNLIIWDNYMKMEPAAQNKFDVIELCRGNGPDINARPGLTPLLKYMP